MNQRDNQRDKTFTRRALFLAAGQLGVFGVLASRLYYLQVIDADRYRTLSDGNRINLKLLAPSRGRILDRNGEILAINRQNYRAIVVREQAGDVEATLNALSQIIEVSEADRRRVLRDVRRKRGFVPVLVRSDLSWDDVARVELNAPDLPGIAIDVGESRLYPRTEAMGHILGYVGAVSEAELRKSDNPILELPDFKIGKSGIERSHDLTLRGAAGSSQVEVNAVGRVIRELSRTEAQAGRDVELTIDYEMQEFVRAEIGTQSAAAVLMEIHTGEVHAMVSAPSFDPNRFTSGLSASDWEALGSDPKSPLTNKTIAGQYAPGSTFKITTALAGLEAGAITAQSTIGCPGYYTLGDTKFYCWQHYGHGSVDVRRALRESCDVFFYEVAKRVGIDHLGLMARRLGYGAPVGIDIPGERPGLMPSQAWKKAVQGLPWVQGETINCGIGQSYVSATPIQLATMISRVANGGRAVAPRLTRRVGGAGPPPAAPNFASIGLNPAHLAIVLGGLIAATNEPFGSSYNARIKAPGMEMAGKTGSAQLHHISTAERDRGIRSQEDLPWHERDNALFVGFAPISAPRYACSVVVEHGMHGPWVAPIAAKILQRVQERDRDRGAPPPPVGALPPAVGAPKATG